MSENKGICGATRATDKKKEIRLECSPILFNDIFDLAAQAGNKGWPLTVMTRVLIRMGIKEYTLNKIAGRKKKDIEADYNKRLAEAQAIAAQKARRKTRKKSDAIVAATPMLFRPDDEE